MSRGSMRSAALALAAIVLLAATLRLIGLDSAPPGLFRDEAEKGYNAWSLAHTGGALEIARTPAGQASLRWTRLPWMIDVMGAPTSAIYQYASIPFVALGGLTAATTRMAAGCVGTLTVLAFGWLLMRAWGPLRGGAAAFWLALSVWHLIFSRWALEGCFVPLLSCGVLAGLWGVRAGRSWGWPLAGAGMGWLFYAYSGAQPFVLAWGFVLLIIYRAELTAARGKPFKHHGGLALGVILLLLPVVPTLFERLQPGGSARLARIAIWSDGAGAWTVAGRFFANYFAHFDPRFLFVHGDSNLRHGVPGWGALAHADALLLIWGIVTLWRRKLPLRGALLAALFCAPIPAALTNEGIPHALRALGMLIPLAALCGLGLAGLLEIVLGYCRTKDEAETPQYSRRLRLLVLILLLLYCADAGRGLVRYFNVMHQDPGMRMAFQTGDRSAWEQVAARRAPAQTVYVDARLPYALYYQAFYLMPDPRKLAVAGPAAAGVVYFDPAGPEAAHIQNAMHSGDWLLYALPADEALSDPALKGGIYTAIRQIPSR